MAKSRTQYVCRECGRTAAKPLGRCPQCGEWNTYREERLTGGAGAPGHVSAPARLDEIESSAERRIELPLEELSRVLGGGAVPGSVVLIGGDPGIGKSTLLLQMSLGAQTPSLYVSGEESAEQIKARADRIANGSSNQLYLVTETDLERVIGHIETVRPQVTVIDSIQTMRTPDIDSAAGTVSQVRESAARLQAVAKASGTAIFLVGHVTKEGSLAGPRLLEHIVDTVLYLEGDAFHSYRLLRSVKNRFGPTAEVGVFEMGSAGMLEVANPSEAFLAERQAAAPGSAIAVTMEGTRPLLVEVQGLTSPTAFGNPRRTANGVDFNRLLLIAAVLTRRVGVPLADQDVFVNVVGGLQIREPAADLALAAAIASSARDRPIEPDLVLIGEVGLSGELRRVPRVGARLAEAAKLGFSRALVPRGAAASDDRPAKLNLIEAGDLRAALNHALADTPTN